MRLNDMRSRARSATSGSSPLWHPLQTPPPDAPRLHAELHRIEVPEAVIGAAGLHDAVQITPSVTLHDGRLWTSVRVSVDRTALRRWGKTYNFLGVLSTDWKLSDARCMRDHTGADGMLEDLRLFSRGSKLHASGTIWQRVNEEKWFPRISVLDLDDEGNIVRRHDQPSARHEKNWMPFVERDELRFVYSVEPVSVILRYDDATQLVQPSAERMPSVAGTLRGGSQMIVYRDGYLAVVHQVHRTSTSWIYVHRFVKFDRFAQVDRISPPFCFDRAGVEFCAGLTEWDGKFVLSYGIDGIVTDSHEDTSMHVAIVEPEAIEELLRA